MDILNLLKDNYSQYKINDSSNRNLTQIQKINEICMNNPNLIVYLKRNNINNEYFNFIEFIEKLTGVIDDGLIDTIIINRDNYIYVREYEKNPTKILRCINNNLLGNDECCVCYESKSKTQKHHICEECQIPLCYKCLVKIDKKICPCCKNNLQISIL